MTKQQKMKTAGSFLLAYCATVSICSYFTVLSNASFFVFLSVACIFVSYIQCKPEKNIQLASFGFSMFFSLTIVFGFSYDQLDSYTLIFKNASSLARAVLCIFSLSLFMTGLLSVIIAFFLKRPSNSSGEVPSRTQLKAFFLFSFVVIFICAIPYLVLYYPGLNIWDTHDQLLQFFGYPSYIGDGTALSDHHPVFLTVIYGFFIKLGMLLGNASYGQFIYSLISITAISFSYTLAFYRLCKHRMSLYTGIFLSVFIAIWPVTATYSFNMCKDVSVAPVILLFSILMLELHFTRGDCFRDRSFRLSFLLCSALLVITRKSAFPSMVFTCLAFLCIYKQVRHLIAVSFTIITVFFLCYNSVLLPALHVIPGESREMFSIPFQQTARYLTVYPEDVTSAELDNLSSVINLDSVQNYDPRLSDPIKDTTNPNATSRDYLNYFKAWFSMGIRHPGVYLDAWLNMIYGYFYPSDSNTILCLTLNSPDIDELTLTQNAAHKPLRLRFYNFVYYTLRRLPVFGQLFYVPFITWTFILLLIILLLKDGIGALVPWSFFIATLGICLLSPKSGEIRYLLPVMYALPVIAGLTSIRKDTAL